MRVIIAGTVVQVEDKTFTSKETGEIVATFDAYLAASDPRYGADRISGPADLKPAVGERVAYLSMVKAQNGRRGPWLSVWCFESLPAVAEAYSAVPA
ncbi:MAG: hypothetical protein ACOYD0_13125 [Candidatus Nanopelagicales bacterium]